MIAPQRSNRRRLLYQFKITRRQLVERFSFGYNGKRLVTATGLSARLEREGQAAARTSDAKPMFQGKSSAMRLIG
jgi:hypothetical protein